MNDPQTALIYSMVVASVADQNMQDVELQRISEMVSHLSVFAGFDPNSIPQIAEDCATMLSQEDGLDEMFERIRDAIDDLELRVKLRYRFGREEEETSEQQEQERLRRALEELNRHLRRLERERDVMEGRD